jgi:hypothetical protein
MLRYLLLHTHEWSDEVIDELHRAIRKPTAQDDTLVHQILDEMTEAAGTRVRIDGGG